VYYRGESLAPVIFENRLKQDRAELNALCSLVPVLARLCRYRRCGSRLRGMGCGFAT